MLLLLLDWVSSRRFPWGFDLVAAAVVVNLRELVLMSPFRGTGLNGRARAIDG
jgi:hypothetical protein